MTTLKKYTIREVVAGITKPQLKIVDKQLQTITGDREFVFGEELNGCEVSVIKTEILIELINDLHFYKYLNSAA